MSVPELGSAGPLDPSRGARPTSAAGETGVSAVGAAVAADAHPAGPGASRDRTRPKLNDSSNTVTLVKCRCLFEFFTLTAVDEIIYDCSHQEL